MKVYQQTYVRTINYKISSMSKNPRANIYGNITVYTKIEDR